ncbi:MAG TPA: serine/threonine-protein kinase [Gemmatimonadales bacterium]|nr:serine/threonine-protein kinase [Gemmatimonadales bacterium]
MPIRRCPKCGRTYAVTDRFCAHDGSTLVEMPDPPKVEPIAAPPNFGERAAALAGATLEGRFKVEKKLGEGGMSYVYLATDLQGGAPVAVKVLSPKLSGDPQSAERLKREAALAMRLSSPYVCNIHAIGSTPDGLLYLVMPFLKGELLSDREHRGGPMDPKEALPLLIQMCLGLAHAHQLEIIHRDLKPENVMLVPDPDGIIPTKAVVMDFGLAKQRQAGPEVQKLTATGIVLGTPEFMSPEQIRGKPLDGRSDVYALGILAFELLTGQLPFQGRNAQELMIARLRGQPRKLREFKPALPEVLEMIIDRSLASDPDQRWQSMQEFAGALDKVGGTDWVTAFSR